MNSREIISALQRDGWFEVAEKEAVCNSSILPKRVV
jgi:hypothetical protein